MKAAPDCIVCMFRQALNTARAATADPALHRRVLARLAAELTAPDLGQTPAALSQAVYRVVSEITGVADPFARHKAATNAEAMRLLPRLEALAAGAIVFKHSVQ